MIVHRYDPPMLLDTPRGPAYCDFVVDYNMHQDFYFHCWVRETGESWTYANEFVRLHPCETTKVRVRVHTRGPESGPESGRRWADSTRLRAAWEPVQPPEGPAGSPIAPRPPGGPGQGPQPAAAASERVGPAPAAPRRADPYSCGPPLR